MYKKPIFPVTGISRNESKEGETIEMKVRRIMVNKEPISDGVEPIYTERKEGVLPAYDIRTDRFDIAIEAMDVVSRTEIARRNERIKERENPKEVETTQEEVGAE